MYNIIFIVTILITLASQSYISSTYQKTKKISSKSHLSGYDVARKILDTNGLQNIEIEKVSGELSDHYDPAKKKICLSEDIYENTSLASISVASHECGHALQDKDGFAFLRIRRSMVPIVNFASRAGYIIIVISVITSFMKFFWIGILLEAIILLFQIITLPVEFDASSRALKQIQDLKMVEKAEHQNCKKMLTAAAFTYVAAVATAILEILRLLMLVRRND